MLPEVGNGQVGRELRADNFFEAFEQITLLLSNARPLWSESAFTENELSWSTKYPNLHRDLLALTEAELHILSEENTLLAYLSSHIPHLRLTSGWTIAKATQPLWQTPARGLFGLPARKKRQTEGFVNALLPFLKSRGEGELGQETIVDWCSGRGLLGRQLHYASSSPVVCLERDQNLCQSGKESHQKMDPVMSRQVLFREQDVLGELRGEYFEKAYLHTTLHACGDLHVAMLQKTSASKVRAIACSPCCYHLLAGDNYRELSLAGRRANLRLTKNELRLATAEMCTATSSERELRDRELLWRVAFDLHLRVLSGVDQYCPTPSVRKSQLKASFGGFAQSAMVSVQKQGDRSVTFRPLSPRQEEALLAKAGQKLARIRRLEKAQLGFRKALEFWLLLDRALFLQDQGYQVRLEEFCDKRDSGRNVVILGLR